MGVSLNLEHPDTGKLVWAYFGFEHDSANWGEVQADVVAFVADYIFDENLTKEQCRDTERLEKWLLDDTISLDHRCREGGFCFGDWTVHVEYQTKEETQRDAKADR